MQSDRAEQLGCSEMGNLEHSKQLECSALLLEHPASRTGHSWSAVSPGRWAYRTGIAEQAGVHREAVQPPKSILSPVLMSHAHKAVATMLPCAPVIDEAAFGNLPTRFKEGAQAPLIHALGDVAHVQVAVVASCEELGCALRLLLLPAVAYGIKISGSLHAQLSAVPAPQLLSLQAAG